MRKLILLACVVAMALCLASPLAAEDDVPDNLVRADTDEGDFFIVSVEVPEVKTDLEGREMTEPALMPISGAGDDIFAFFPEVDAESDVPDNLVMPGTTDGDAFIVSMPEEEEASKSGSSSKTLGGIALLGCLGTGIVVYRKAA
jgi:hypothetical protein